MIVAFLSAAMALNQTSIDAKIEGLIQAMTLEEKVSLCHGGSDFGTKAIPRLGIPEFRFSDGPNGVRDQEQIPTTYFPTGISMAATWDPRLIRHVGEAIGEEADALGKSVMLAPAVNIDRTPLGGRTFEYYSEDPFLAKEIAVGYINGVQSKGVLACVKHYAANSVERERTTVDAQLDERTLREIYLPAFEGAVKEARVGSVMAAYNKVNGEYCAENPHLLKDILRSEWGFKGFVMSDWGAVHSTVPTALNGLDLEMPGGKDNHLGAPLLEAAQKGEVPVSAIDEMVRHTLRALWPYEKPDRAEKLVKGGSAVTKQHADLARRVAEQAVVLLKNEGVLPLDGYRLQSLAVIGPNANAKFGAEGGSGSVITSHEITPLQGMQDALGNRVHFELGVEGPPDYSQTIPSSVLRTPDGQPGLTAEYWDNEKFQGKPKLVRIDPSVEFNWDTEAPGPGIPREHFSARWTGLLIPQESGTYRIGTESDDGSSIFMDGHVIVDNGGYHGGRARSTIIKLQKGVPYAIRVRFFQGEGGAHIHFFWNKIDESAQTPLQRAVALAGQSTAVVVFAGINHEYDTEGADKPNMKLPEGQDALIEAVCDANPNTVVVLLNGTPVEMPWIAKARAVVEAWYPGMEGGHAIANVVLGHVNPCGKLPVTFPNKLEDSPAHANGDYPPKNGVLKYDEGILVGYRYFDTKGVEPLFPFGYGLSYTSFAYRDIEVRDSGDARDVSFTIENNGPRPGAEVAQVYVHQDTPHVLRPEKELKGFQKVFLNPGEAKRITVHLPSRAFAYWSEASYGWVVDDGASHILVGSSSRDIRLRAATHLGR